MKFDVQFRDHPLVKAVEAKTKDEAIEKAKAERGLDGIGHEVNGLVASVCETPKEVVASVPPAPFGK